MGKACISTDLWTSDFYKSQGFLNSFLGFALLLRALASWGLEENGRVTWLPCTNLSHVGAQQINLEPRELCYRLWQLISYQRQTICLLSAFPQRCETYMNAMPQCCPAMSPADSNRGSATRVMMGAIVRGPMNLIRNPIRPENPTKIWKQEATMIVPCTWKSRGWKQRLEGAPAVEPFLHVSTNAAWEPGSVSSDRLA